MILQALSDYYEALSARGEIVRRNWSRVRVSFALVLDRDGQLLRIMPLSEEVERGKKTVEIPMLMTVPEQNVRAVNIAPNLLCDSSGYLLGIDAKGKPARTATSFQKAKEAHEALLGAVDSPVARAVCAFFERWEPEKAAENEVLAPYLEDILKGGNLIFRFDGKFAQDDEAIQRAWDTYKEDSDAPVGRCLVTGEEAPIARLHPKIKGVRDAQSSGASLVSFNADAFTSYGKEQSFNAPVSERAAYAYGTALNTLIADSDHTQYLGDTLILYWAKSAEVQYQNMFNRCFGDNDALKETDVAFVMKELASGKSCELEGKPLSPDMEFFVLGIAPNAARLMVRFFYRNSFGKLLENFAAHQARLEIVRPVFDVREQISLWQLLNETANRNSRDKKPPQALIGPLLRAVLENTPYPALLYNAILMRVRAEHEINRNRAAVIKAYLIKQLENRQDEGASCAKEVLTVQLNEQSTYQPYLLGRLFAVLEQLQLSANPNISTTIRDRYFNAACTNPATAFPILLRLAQNHLRKLDKGTESYIGVSYSKRIGELMAKMDAAYPHALSLQDQGIFQIGYYHQTQKFYEKKEK